MNRLLLVLTAILFSVVFLAPYAESMAAPASVSSLRERIVTGNSAE